MDTEEGILAVKTARDFISSETGGPFIGSDLPKSFNSNSGVFVTLNTFPGNELRGCIGIPEPIYPLYESLEYAARSACHDPRFIDLQFSELDDITVEVTILTKPQIVQVDRDSLIDWIVIGKHGLIIEGRGKRGLLLPQVPEELGWDQIDYLEGLCRKAGLKRGSWRDSDIKLYSFEGEVFSEIEPYGPVERR